MTAPIPRVEPEQIVAGDTIQWQKSFPDYPSTDGWALSYVLINTENKYTINATTSGSDYLVSVSAATSAPYVSGVYKWQAYLTNGSNRITIEKGEIEIVTDFGTASAYDDRSPVKISLDAIEAVLAKRATIDQQMYMIQGRRLERTPIPDLIILRSHYARLYAGEKNADRLKNGEPPSNRIYTRF